MREPHTLKRNKNINYLYIRRGGAGQRGGAAERRHQRRATALRCVLQRTQHVFIYLSGWGWVGALLYVFSVNPC